MSDIKTRVSKLQSAAKTLRRVATELQSVGIHVTEIYAEGLRDVASDCDDDAKVIKPTNDPWLVTRKRGDLRRKTFVAKLSYTTHLLFMKTLHNPIANVTNVVFCSEQHGATPITGETVREMLRGKACAFAQPLGLERHAIDRGANEGA